jgi:hypothetical protein
MNEEYVIDESLKAKAVKAVKAVEYDQTKKQVVVLEDGKPLFVWMYPRPDYSNIDEALSGHFGVDMYVVPNPALVPGAGGWLGSKGVMNGGISGIEQVVHVYEVIALPIVY